MLPKLGSPFRMKNIRNGKLRSEDDENSRNLKAVGLGTILVHPSPQQNLVVKQSIKLTFSSLPPNSINNPCFLRSCFLCKQNLNPHEDIYMYRGDQGYCSIKCRNQQIETDEKTELEASTRKILASFRKCHKNKNQTQTQTRLLLQDLRRQHNRIPHTTIPPLVS